MARRKKLFKVPTLKQTVNKALGITQAKREFARKTGIPTTKSGRQRKFKKILNPFK